MIEKGKISAFQMAVIMSPTIVATAVLLVPAITVNHAKQDLWISPLWAGFCGLVVIFIAFNLNKLFPNESIIEYAEHIIGSFFGKILGLIYVLFYMHINGVIIREYSEFVTGTFLSETPLFIIMGSMVLVCAFAVYGGIEVIGRSSEIILPVVYFLFIIILVLLIRDLDIKNIFPIMENGITPSLIGSIVPQGWLSEFFLIAFLLPFLKNRKKGFTYSVASVLSVVFILMSSNLVTYMLFGELTGVFAYPVMVAVRYVSIADFLEHLESIVMAIWVSGTFIKISVFYYINVISIAQWLKLSSYQPIVFPVGFLLIVFSIWSAPNLRVLTTFLSTTAPFYFIFVQGLIPMLLLCIALLRKKLGQKEEA